MKPNKWDRYFHTHYHPLGKAWGQRDILRYEQWYFSWINYLEKRCSVLRKKARIFEIGSAVGAVANMLAQRGHEVVGSDISPFMVKKAGELVPSVPFVLCDIQKPIPLKKKFDVIMGFEVLEHVPDLHPALANIKTSLRPGGYFIGTSPYPYPKNHLDGTHVNVKYPHEWEALFRKSGFLHVETSPMSFFPFLWRLGKYCNPVIPRYISWPFFVSTTLIVAQA